MLATSRKTISREENRKNTKIKIQIIKKKISSKSISFEMSVIFSRFKFKNAEKLLFF